MLYLLQVKLIVGAIMLRDNPMHQLVALLRSPHTLAIHVQEILMTKLYVGVGLMTLPNLMHQQDLS